MLRDIAKPKELPPPCKGSRVNVVPDETSAGVCLVAPDDTRWKNAVVLSDVVEGDVVE